VRRNVAYAYLPAETAVGDGLEVEVLGDPVAAQVAADVLYDPGHERVRGSII
jgi:glycine cleavage system aminomethyltransferase T